MAVSTLFRGPVVVELGFVAEFAAGECDTGGTKQDEGLDVDIANAIGEKLGVRLRFIDDTDFAGIITALRAGRFDIIMSAMNDTAERRGKGVDFIDSFRAGTSIIAKKGNPQGLHTLDDLCGKTVAVQKGTIQETDILDP